MTWDEGSATEPRLDPMRRDRDGLGQREDRISKELARMSETIDMLAERLTPILGPERPSAVLGAAGGAEDTASDLTRFLEHVSDQQRSLVERLRGLVERVDL